MSFKQYLINETEHKPTSGLHPVILTHIEPRVQKRWERDGVSHTNRKKLLSDVGKGDMYTYLTKKQSEAYHRGETINKSGYHYKKDEKAWK